MPIACQALQVEPRWLRQRAPKCWAVDHQEPQVEARWLEQGALMRQQLEPSANQALQVEADRLRQGEIEHLLLELVALPDSEDEEALWWQQALQRWSRARNARKAKNLVQI